MSKMLREQQQQHRVLLQLQQTAAPSAHVPREHFSPGPGAHALRTGKRKRGKHSKREKKLKKN